MTKVALLCQAVARPLRELVFVMGYINDSKFPTNNTNAEILKTFGTSRNLLADVVKEIEAYKIAKDPEDLEDNVMAEGCLTAIELTNDGMETERQKKYEKWKKENDLKIKNICGDVEILCGTLREDYYYGKDYFPAKKGCRVYVKGDFYVLYFTSRYRPTETKRVEYARNSLRLLGKIDSQHVELSN